MGQLHNIEFQVASEAVVADVEARTEVPSDEAECNRSRSKGGAPSRLWLISMGVVV